MRLLLLEPDARLAQTITEQLRRDGHEVEWQHRADAIAQCDDAFDAWLVDAAAPRQPRLRRLHKKAQGPSASLPVILMGDRPATLEQLAAWDAGLNDWLLKPVSLDLLRNRVTALARRITQPMACRVVAGDVDIDWDRRIVTHQGRRVHLTLQEWEVLSVLAAQPGRAASKQRLLSALSGAASINAVEFHVSRLRRKIGAGAIETLRGSGYRLAV